MSKILMSIATKTTISLCSYSFFQLHTVRLFASVASVFLFSLVYSKLLIWNAPFVTHAKHHSTRFKRLIYWLASAFMCFFLSSECVGSRPATMRRCRMSFCRHKEAEETKNAALSKEAHTHTQNKTREDHRLYRVAPPPSQRHSFIFPFHFTSILVSPCLSPCFSVEFILSTESSDLYTNVCILDTHCSTHP